jgi:hypothetical protein
MALIFTALGLFYIAAAALVLRRARADWSQARSAETMRGGPRLDRDRLWFMSCSALVNGGAGLALVLRSDWAVWLLGAGLVMQATYYSILSPLAEPEGGDAGHWRKIWNAAIVTTAAFALAAYGHRIGVLA